MTGTIGAKHACVCTCEMRVITPSDCYDAITRLANQYASERVSCENGTCLQLESRSYDASAIEPAIEMAVAVSDIVYYHDQRTRESAAIR